MIPAKAGIQKPPTQAAPGFPAGRWPPGMTLCKPSGTHKIGTGELPVRFGVPPEIVLVTLGRPTRQAALPALGPGSRPGQDA